MRANPLLLGYDLGYNVIGPALTGGKKKNGKLNKQVRPIIESYGTTTLSPETVAGEGLYAQTNMRGRGNPNNTAKGSKKRDVIQLPQLERFPKVRQVPPSFQGGALQRNTQHRNATDIGVGGNLLSNFEQHPAMRSQPYMTHFHQSNQLPLAYQKYHNISI